MKNILIKIRDAFYKLPILMSFIASFIISFFVSISVWLADSFHSQNFGRITDIPAFMLIASIIIIPIILTAENIAFLIMKQKTGKQETAVKKIEILTIILGIVFSVLYLSILMSDE